MNLLFLNAGRRCELIEAFRRALQARGGGGIFGSDVSPLAPALQVVDYAVISPKGDSAEFPDFILDFCRRHEIDLVIPTIDPDLFRLDALRERFAEELPDCRLLLSPSYTLRHARDKRLSKKLFAALGAEVPEAVDQNDPDLSFPVFVKPPGGSAGEGAGVVNDRTTLLNLLGHDPDLMVERVVAGPEYTVDVLCDFSGRTICAVPRRRLRVRAGEVVQGVVERSRELESLAMRMAEGFQATGPVTVQFRRAGEDRFVAMEVNARMGGGLPLTIAAGADWPGWILDLCLGREPDIAVDIADGLLMTRCDRSFYVTGDRLNSMQSSHEPLRKPAEGLWQQVREARAWIFDLDDTLYPERDFVFSGYRAVAVRVHADFAVDIEGDLRERFIQGERGDLFSRSLRQSGIRVEEPYIKTLVEIYRAHSPVIRPYLDVVPTLRRLRDLGRKTGLVSDGWLEVQRRKLAALGIGELFDAVVFTDAINGVKSWKPAADGFVRCLDEMAVPPAAAVYVGDNPGKDFIGARALGMASIRVHRRGGEHEHRQAAGCEYEPDLSFSSFQGILELL